MAVYARLADLQALGAECARDSRRIGAIERKVADHEARLTAIEAKPRTKAAERVEPVKAKAKGKSKGKSKRSTPCAIHSARKCNRLFWSAVGANQHEARLV